MASLPIYSHRLLAEAGFIGEAGFLVPAGSVLVVRDIDVWCPVGIGASVQAGIGGSAVFWGYTFGVVTVQAHQAWRGRLALVAGEQLVISTDAALDFVASGYLLTAQ